MWQWAILKVKDNAGRGRRNRKRLQIIDVKVPLLLLLLQVLVCLSVFGCVLFPILSRLSAPSASIHNYSIIKEHSPVHRSIDLIAFHGESESATWTGSPMKCQAHFLVPEYN